MVQVGLVLLLELFHIRHQKSDRLAGRAVPGKGSTNAIMQRGEMASSWKCASGVSCVVKWLIISHLTANKDLCSIILFIDAANIFLIAIVTYLIFSVVGWLATLATMSSVVSSMFATCSINSYSNRTTMLPSDKGSFTLSQLEGCKQT